MFINYCQFLSQPNLEAANLDLLLTATGYCRNHFVWWSLELETWSVSEKFALHYLVKKSAGLLQLGVLNLEKSMLQYAWISKIE